MPSCPFGMIISSISFHYLKHWSLCSASQGPSTDGNTGSGSHKAIQPSYFFFFFFASKRFKKTQTNYKQKLCLRKSYPACKARLSRDKSDGGLFAIKHYGAIKLSCTIFLPAHFEVVAYCCSWFDTRILLHLLKSWEIYWERKIVPARGHTNWRISMYPLGITSTTVASCDAWIIES